MPYSTTHTISTQSMGQKCRTSVSVFSSSSRSGSFRLSAAVGEPNDPLQSPVVLLVILSTPTQRHSHGSVRYEIGNCLRSLANVECVCVPYTYTNTQNTNTNIQIHTYIHNHTNTYTHTHIHKSHTQTHTRNNNALITRIYIHLQFTVLARDIAEGKEESGNLHHGTELDTRQRKTPTEHFLPSLLFITCLPYCSFFICWLYFLHVAPVASLSCVISAQHNHSSQEERADKHNKRQVRRKQRTEVVRM